MFNFSVSAFRKNPGHYKKSIVILSFLGIVLSAYIVHRHNLSSLPPPPAKVVETEVIKPQRLRKSIELIGTIQAKHTTVLVAKSSGILDTLLNSGQTVQKGKLIAKIVNHDLEKSHQLAKATEKIAKAQFERLSALQKTGYVSARETEEKKQVWIDAQKALAKSKSELGNSRFYAPFDGIIGAFKRKEGALLNEGDAVVTVYDPNSLSVDLDIPCANLKTITENQPVKLLKHDYQLTHIQKMMDSDSHMCPADIDISCTKCVIGASVRVELVVKEIQQALVVPAQALFLKNGKTYVYTVVNNQIELTAVKSGLRQKDNVEITQGLKTGDQIVIKSPERLYPGLNVSVYQPENRKAQG